MKPRESWRALLCDVLLFAAACTGGALLLLRVVPPDYDLQPVQQAYNFTCAPLDLARYVEEQQNISHWALPRTVVDKFRSNTVAGTWLPLCGSAQVACMRGFRGEPEISCSYTGEYSSMGLCEEVTCGEPPEVADATRLEVGQGWRSGFQVHYQCNKGFAGNPVATCGIDGVFSMPTPCEPVRCSKLPVLEHGRVAANLKDPERNFSVGETAAYECEEHYVGKGEMLARCCDDGHFDIIGSCKRVCEDLPTIPHAKPPVGAEEKTWLAGDVAHFQCEEGSGGSPVAKCGEDGTFKVTDACATLCGRPPKYLGATPLNLGSETSIPAGTSVLYQCDPGYGGSLVAVCTEDGTYRREGRGCSVVCGMPQEFPHATAHLSSAGHVSDWSTGAHMRYECDAGYRGKFLATCKEGTWVLPPEAHCEHLGCGSLEDFLTESIGSHWKGMVEQTQAVNITSDSDSDAIIFKCKDGYEGQHFVLCVQQQWKKWGECKHTTTQPPPQTSAPSPAPEVRVVKSGAAAPFAIGFSAASGLAVGGLWLYKFLTRRRIEARAFDANLQLGESAGGARLRDRSS